MLKFACDEIEFWKVSHLQTFYAENQSIYSYYSRSSVSLRFPWLSGTFFTSLQSSTGGRSVKIICQAKKCHVKQKTKKSCFAHRFNWNAWSCQLYQPNHLWSLLLLREKLSAATDINHEVRFAFLVLSNSRNSDKTVSTGFKIFCKRAMSKSNNKKIIFFPDERRPRVTVDSLQRSHGAPPPSLSNLFSFWL